MLWPFGSGTPQEDVERIAEKMEQGFATFMIKAALPNLLPGGHCFMSTLRLADDVTDFASRIERAVARVCDRPGLGIEIDLEKLERYTAHRMEI